jgi:hypothetical protein
MENLQVWCGLVSLAEKFPRLYEINKEQECLVEIMKNRNWCLTFRRWLYEDLQIQLRRLQDIVFRCATHDCKDQVRWDWEKSGIFSVKSTYKHLCKNDLGANFKKIWKAKIPLKIKIFMWLVSQDVILTKDNLCKRKWKGNTSCAFCPDPENGNHLFFGCPTAKYIWSLLAFSLGPNCRPGNLDQYWVWIDNVLPQGPQMHVVGLAAVCWAIWHIRNVVCFDNKRVKSPTEIVSMICSFLTYWAGLLKENLRQQVNRGAEAVKTAALLFHGQEMRSQAQDEMQLIPFVG